MIDIFGFSIYEPDVAITDAILFVESVLFAYLILKRSRPSSGWRKIFVWIFFSIAASSFLGSIFHAFFPKKVSTLPGYYVWVAIAFSIGITATALWQGIIYTFKDKSWYTKVKRLLMIYPILVVLAVVFVSTSFTTIAAFYIPVLVLFQITAVMIYIKTKSHAWAWVSLGILLSLLAGVIQFLQVSLHPIYFNHNALYHLVQAIGLFFFYIGAHVID